MQPLLTELLNLGGIEVENYHNFGDHIMLEVEAKTSCAMCPRCGQESANVHQNHWHIAQDLRISGRDIFLKYTRRQFKCKICKKPFSETLDFIGERRQYTDRFAEFVIKQLVHSDIHNVAKNNNITDDVVQSMLEYLSRKKWTFDPSRVQRLGIDEIALRKGQGDYVVVFADLDRNELVGMAPSRQHTDIKKELKAWGDEILSQIEEVSIDLSGNYRSLVKKCMPNADIVADRFHVMKVINDEFNKAINSTKRAVNEIENEEEREQSKKVLAKSKYALLKPEENLTEKQKVKLQEVKENFPILAEMHQQKENFRDIFETSTDWTDGTFRLMDWMKDVQDLFQDSIGTICRWFAEITTYFETRTTSGAVEGINNRLKLIKRLGYGFRNFENFRLRCLMCWHLAIS